MKKLLFLLPLLFFLGCTYRESKAPYPIKHKSTTQYELQAVWHWKLIAKDFANSLKLPKEETYLETDTPNSVFAKSFYNLLKVELINKGVPLSATPYYDDVKLRVKINVVKFNSDRNLKKFPYKLTLLASGLWVASGLSPIAGAAVATTAIAVGETANNDAINKFYKNPPKYEIDIEAFAVKHNRYIAGVSRIYYIADEDANLYLPKKELPIIRVKGSEYEK